MGSEEVVATLEKMLRSLPEEMQERVVEHMREYILDLRDELHWENLFERSRDQLAAEARRAKEQIRSGRAEPMDFDRL